MSSFESPQTPKKEQGGKPKSSLSKFKNFTLAGLAAAGLVGSVESVGAQTTGINQEKPKFYVYKGERPMLVNGKTITQGDTVYYPMEHKRQAPALTSEQILREATERERKMVSDSKAAHAHQAQATYWEGFSIMGNINSLKNITKRVILTPEEKKEITTNGTAMYVEGQYKNYDIKDGVARSVEIVNLMNKKNAEAEHEEWLNSLTKYNQEVQRKKDEQGGVILNYESYDPNKYFVIDGTNPNLHVPYEFTNNKDDFYLGENVFTVESKTQKVNGEDKIINTYTIVGVVVGFFKSTTDDGHYYSVVKYLQPEDANLDDN